MNDDDTPDPYDEVRFDANMERFHIPRGVDPRQIAERARRAQEAVNDIVQRAAVADAPVPPNADSRRWFLAGYLSSLPEYEHRHPETLLPLADQILTVLAELGPPTPMQRSGYMTVVVTDTGLGEIAANPLWEHLSTSLDANGRAIFTFGARPDQT